MSQAVNPESVNETAPVPAVPAVPTESQEAPAVTEVPQSAPEPVKAESKPEPATLSVEWLNSYADTAGVNPLFKQSLPMLASLTQTIQSAVAKLAFAGNPGDIAIKLWQDAGGEDVAKYQELDAKIAAVMAQLAPIVEERDAIAESGAKNYSTQAAEYATANTPAIRSEYQESRKNLAGFLTILVGPQWRDVVAIPSVQGVSSGSGTNAQGERVKGGWRPKLSALAISTDGGVSFAPINATGTTGLPTMSDAASRIEYSGTTASFSAELKAANNGNDIPAGETVDIQYRHGNTDYVFRLTGIAPEVKAESETEAPAA